MLQDADLDLIDGYAFAVLTTLRRDGAPHSTVMWYRRVDDELRMIAPASAAKSHNLLRDGRVSVVITDPENGYRYVEIRGVATVVRDDGHARRELVDIAARYIGDAAESYAASLSSDPRVLIVIRPDHVRSHHGKPPGSRPAG